MHGRPQGAVGKTAVIFLAVDGGEVHQRVFERVPCRRCEAGPRDAPKLCRSSRTTIPDKPRRPRATRRQAHRPFPWSPEPPPDWKRQRAVTMTFSLLLRWPETRAQQRRRPIWILAVQSARWSPTEMDRRVLEDGSRCGLLAAPAAITASVIAVGAIISRRNKAANSAAMTAPPIMPAAAPTATAFAAALELATFC